MCNSFWRCLPLSILLSIFFVSPIQAAEHWRIGLTSTDMPIEATVVDGASASAPTVMLIGGLQGRDATADAVTREAVAFEGVPLSRRAFRYPRLEVPRD